MGLMVDTNVFISLESCATSYKSASGSISWVRSGMSVWPIAIETPMCS